MAQKVRSEHSIELNLFFTVIVRLPVSKVLINDDTQVIIVRNRTNGLGYKISSLTQASLPSSGERPLFESSDEWR